MDRFFLSILLVLTSYFTFGQNTSELDFINSAGRATASIPLFELQMGHLKIPVSLDYSSSGMLYDDVESNAGVGWTVRNLDFFYEQQIRGRDDLQSVLPNMDSIGILLNNMTPPISMNDQKLEKDMILANFAVRIYGETSDFPYSTHYAAPFPWDSGYDIFTFHTLSGQNKFIYHLRNQPLETLFADDEINHSANMTNLNYATYNFRVESLKTYSPKVRDNNGVLYIYEGEHFYEGGSIRRKYLSDVRDMQGREINFYYHPFYLQDSTREKTLGILEGHDRFPSTPVETQISESPLSSYYTKKLRATYIGTPTINVDICYTLFRSQPLIEQISIYTKGSTPKLLKSISFTYLYGQRHAFLKHLTIKPEGDEAMSDQITFEYYYENELETALFDRDIDGFVHKIYFSSVNDSSTYFNDSFGGMQIYQRNHGMPPFQYNSLNNLIQTSGMSIPMAHKIQAPDMMGYPGIPEGTHGVLKAIRHPLGLTETYKYGYNMITDRSMVNVYGVRLAEYLRTIPKPGDVLEKTPCSVKPLYTAKHQLITLISNNSTVMETHWFGRA